MSIVIVIALFFGFICAGLWGYNQGKIQGIEEAKSIIDETVKDLLEKWNNRN